MESSRFLHGMNGKYHLETSQAKRFYANKENPKHMTSHVEGYPSFFSGVQRAGVAS